MKDRFMKNGVFSLEYDKETLRDIVLELQQENKNLLYYKKIIDKSNLYTGKTTTINIKKVRQEIESEIAKLYIKGDE